MELDQLVLLDGDAVETYRVFWPPDPNLVQSRAGLALVVLVRRSAGGGVLLALPSALVSVGSFPVEPTEYGTIGPHTRMEVPGVRLAEDGMDELEVELDVQLVDVGVQALSAITPLAQVPQLRLRNLRSFFMLVCLGTSKCQS